MLPNLPCAKYWFAPDGFVIRIRGDSIGKRQRHSIRLFTDGRCVFESHPGKDFKVIESLLALGHENHCGCVAVRRAFREASEDSAHKNELVRCLRFDADVSAKYIDEVAALHEWWVWGRAFRLENRLVRRFFRRRRKLVNQVVQKVVAAPVSGAVSVLQNGLFEVFSAAGTQAVEPSVYRSYVTLCDNSINVSQAGVTLPISAQQLRHPKVVRAVIEHALRWAFACLYKATSLANEMKIAEEMSCLPEDVLNSAAELEEEGVLVLRNITDPLSMMGKTVDKTDGMQATAYRHWLKQIYLLRLNVDRMQDFQVLAALRMWKAVEKYMVQKQNAKKGGISHAKS